MQNLAIKLIIDQNDVDAFNAIYKEKHPKAKKIPIKLPQHPSLNEYMGMQNVARNNIKQAWKDFIVWVLTGIGLANKKINKCRLTYITYFKHDRRHDLDNISPKFILDGFVAAGLFVDDDFNHIISLTTQCGIDKENPRMEFIVEIVE